MGLPQTSEVQIESLVVVFTQQLCMDFGDSVNSFWSLNAQVRCWIPRGFRAESSDCAGYEEFEFICKYFSEDCRARVLLVIVTLLAELYHVVETLDVDPDCQGDVVLSHGGQEGREVDQPVNPLVDHDLLQTLEVQHVSEHKGS